MKCETKATEIPIWVEWLKKKWHRDTKDHFYFAEITRRLDLLCALIEVGFTHSPRSVAKGMVRARKQFAKIPLSEYLISPESKTDSSTDAEAERIRKGIEDMNRSKGMWGAAMMH